MAPRHAPDDDLVLDLYERTRQAIRDLTKQVITTGEPLEKHAIVETVEATVPPGYPALVAGTGRRRMIRDLANDIIADLMGGDAA